MNDHARRWEELLNPEITRERLISSSLFITAFEFLKQSICDRIKDFYCFGFDESGGLLEPKYQTEVLARNRSPVYASLSWLQENGAIEQSDIDTFERIKAARNQLAHNLYELVAGNFPSGHVELFTELVELIRKIEVWWLVNVEIPTNPDYDGQEIREDAIIPGPVIMLQLMLEVASGNEQFLQHFRRSRE